MFFMDTLDIKNAIKLNFFTVDMLKNVLSKEYDQPIQKINPDYAIEKVHS